MKKMILILFVILVAPLFVLRTFHHNQEADSETLTLRRYYKAIGSNDEKPETSLPTFPNATSQDPNCMSGANDILCQSSRLQQKLQRESQGNRTGGINDERIYNPDAGSYAEGLVEKYRKDFEESFDSSQANLKSLDYNPTKDRCIMEPNCNSSAKLMAHHRWLYETCLNGNQAACQKLKREAFTAAPIMRYPNGEGMNVPYAPGTGPVPSVDPFANIRSAP